MAMLCGDGDTGFFLGDLGHLDGFGWSLGVLRPAAPFAFSVRASPRFVKCAGERKWRRAVTAYCRAAQGLPALHAKIWASHGANILSGTTTSHRETDPARHY